MFLASKDALALFDIIEYTHGLIVANSAEVAPSGRRAPHGEEVGVGGRGPPEEESGRGCGLHDHGDGPDVGHGAHPVRSPLQLEQVPNAPDDNFFLPKGLQVLNEDPRTEVVRQRPERGIGGAGDLARLQLSQLGDGDVGVGRRGDVRLHVDVVAGVLVEVAAVLIECSVALGLLERQAVLHGPSSVRDVPKPFFPDSPHQAV